MIDQFGGKSYQKKSEFGQNILFCEESRRALCQLSVHYIPTLFTFLLLILRM